MWKCNWIKYWFLKLRSNIWTIINIGNKLVIITRLEYDKYSLRRIKIKCECIRFFEALKACILL